MATKQVEDYNIILKNVDVPSGKAEEFKMAYGKNMASLMQVLMDKEFIMNSRGTKFFVHWFEVPRRAGWYHFNREKDPLAMQYMGVWPQTMERFPWHERLFVTEYAVTARRERRYASLHVDHGATGNICKLILSGSGNNGDVTKVAIVEKINDVQLRK